MFGTLMKSVNRLGDKLQENVSRISENIAADQRELLERASLYGCLWEPNESVAQW